jgi:hypothetical protein
MRNKIAGGKDVLGEKCQNSNLFFLRREKR